MRLHSLRLTNFRQHANTSIEFGPGLTGIIGPNGAGKTTLLEAIAWALYGSDAARGKRESIRFLRADARAPVRVELDFDLGGHRYRIVRGLTSAELFLDGGADAIASSVTTVTDVVQRRLGMSRSEFFNTYFTGQKELSVMTALGPTERAQFLSRVLGYERLRTAQDLVRERRRELTGELAGMRQTMPDAETIAGAVADATARVRDATERRDAARAAYTAARTTLETLTPQWEAAQVARARRQHVAGDLRVAQQLLESRERDVLRAVAASRDAESAQAALTALTPELAPHAALAAERDALDALARDAGRRAALADAVKAAEEDLVRLGERRARLDAAVREAGDVIRARDALRADVAAADAALDAARTAWARDRQDAETRRDALRMQYVDVKTQRERIVEAGEDGTCPTCLRPLGTHFRGVLDVLHSQLETLRVDGSYYRARLDQLQHAPADVTTLDERRRQLSAEAATLERRAAEADVAAKELADVARSTARHEERLANARTELASLPSGYDAARHAEVRAALAHLAPLAAQVVRLTALVEQAATVHAERERAVAARDEAVRQVTDLTAAVAAHEADERQYEALQVEHRRAADAAAAADVAAREAEFARTAADDTLVRARTAADALARAERRLAELTRERRLHDELDHTYTDLRTDLNFALRPELSRLASVFLAELTDDRYSELDLDDQYNLVVVEDGVPKPVISGGEEDVANLVLRLAISQMIAERAGQPFSLLILDEVLGSLDEIRRQNVVALLRALRDRFEQVILITHLEAVRDGCDRVLSVRYDAATGASAVHAAESEEAPPVRRSRVATGA